MGAGTEPQTKMHECSRCGEVSAADGMQRCWARGGDYVFCPKCTSMIDDLAADLTTFARSLLHERAFKFAPYRGEISWETATRLWLGERV